MQMPPADCSCCIRPVANRLRRAFLQLSNNVSRRVRRWPEGSWPDALQRSPHRVRTSARDVIKGTAQAAIQLGQKAARLGLDSLQAKRKF